MCKQCRPRSDAAERGVWPGSTVCITKTYLYNFDPLKPHFYIVKLGFTGVYIIFLISAQNIDCGYSLEPPRRVVLTSTHNLCFEQKYEKYRRFLSEIFQFLEMKFSMYLNRRVFVMALNTGISMKHGISKQKNTNQTPLILEMDRSEECR